MKDNDDRDPLRRLFSSPSGDGGERQDDPSLAAGVHVARATRADPANQVAPTDPEVPAAKKRGILRRRRSLVGLSVLVALLLSMTVSLLFRAGQHVSASRTGPSGTTQASTVPGADVLFRPQGNAPASLVTDFRPPAAVPYRNELDDDAHHADRRPADAAAATSAGSQPKGPPAALDIIRAPAF